MVCCLSDSNRYSVAKAPGVVDVFVCGDVATGFFLDTDFIKEADLLRGVISAILVLVAATYKLLGVVQYLSNFGLVNAVLKTNLIYIISVGSSGC